MLPRLYLTRGAACQLKEFDRLDQAFLQLYLQQGAARIAIYLPLIITVSLIEVDGVTAG
jgi:hypothetical protein